MSRTAIKAVFIGGAGTGKTAFCRRLLRDTFSSSYYATFGAEVSDKDFQTSGEHKWQLWDLSGQERYQEMLAFYLRRSRAVLIFVDATRPVKSIDELSGFENIPQDALCTVIFTKSDNEQAFDFTESACLSYVKDVQERLKIPATQFKIEASYFITSARTGDGINEAMAAMETPEIEVLEHRIQGGQTIFQQYDPMQLAEAFKNTADEQSKEGLKQQLERIGLVVQGNYTAEYQDLLNAINALDYLASKASPEDKLRQMSVGGDNLEAGMAALAVHIIDNLLPLPAFRQEELSPGFLALTKRSANQSDHEHPVASFSK